MDALDAHVAAEVRKAMEGAQQNVIAGIFEVCRKDPMPSIGRIEAVVKTTIRAMIPEVQP